MADVEQVAVEHIALAADGAALPAHLAVLRVGQAAQQAQQTGLATAIATGHAQRLARTDLEIEAREELASPSGVAEAAGLQCHGGVPSMNGYGGTLSTGVGGHKE